MSAVLNTNYASLVASKNLLGAQNKLAASVERLSSGLRVNRARDDAAGLGVANSLTAQINGANQGIRNLNDAISMVQTAEGAIAAATDLGQRILMLATQGANGTLGATERAAIKSEMLQLMSSIDSISGRTAFSGNPLLGFATNNPAGANSDFYSMQISNTATDKVSLSSTAFTSVGSTGRKSIDSAATLVFRSTTENSNVLDLRVTGTNVTSYLPTASESTAHGASQKEINTVTFQALSSGQSISVAGESFTANEAMTATEVATAFATGSSQKGVFSGVLSGWTKASTVVDDATDDKVLYTTTAAVNVEVDDITPSVGVINQGGAGYTEELAINFGPMTNGQTIILTAGAAVLTFTAGSGAPTGSQVAKAFFDYLDGGVAPAATIGAFVTSGTGAIASTWALKNYDSVSGTDSGAGQASALLASIIDVDASASAAAATAKFQAVQTAASAYVVSLGEQRSLLGAYQNQMEYTLSNITDLSANLSSARSRVIDTDYASETAALTRGQILQQAATAMLAQANQMPNVILTLLK